MSQDTIIPLTHSPHIYPPLKHDSVHLYSCIFAQIVHAWAHSEHEPCRRDDAPYTCSTLSHHPNCYWSALMCERRDYDGLQRYYDGWMDIFMLCCYVLYFIDFIEDACVIEN